MRKLPDYPLWIGHAGDLRDPSAILAAGIEAVVEVADNEPFALLPREVVRLRFPLSDGGANPDWLLRLAANSLGALVEAHIATLVCCSQGLSRSVCVAAAGLVVGSSCSFDDAIQLVAAAGPTDVSPALWAQFKSALEH